MLAVARRDTEAQERARLEAGQSVFNYGVHFTYRWQRNEAVGFFNNAFANESTTNAAADYVQRSAQLFIPDVWAKFERNNLRIELEASAYLGNVTNSAMTTAASMIPGRNQSLGIIEFGGVLQGEYKLLDGALSIAAEVGFASGDEAPGFGNFPGRVNNTPTRTLTDPAHRDENVTVPGNIDGAQYSCQSTGGCSDSVIKNFRFNRDYRIDMILFREILGGVTDALYVKPTLRYRIADGLTAWGSVIYSRAIYTQSTPSYDPVSGRGDPNLGLEVNLGARYETEDGFFGELRWGILFPLGGFADNRASGANTTTSLDSAQALRGTVGIRF